MKPKTAVITIIIFRNPDHYYSIFAAGRVRGWARMGTAGDCSGYSTVKERRKT